MGLMLEIPLLKKFWKRERYYMRERAKDWAKKAEENYKTSKSLGFNF